MSKVKTNKRSSVLKTVGLVFMVVTLLAALSLTNNRVRQFITDSLAYDPICAGKGNPSARRACQEPIDEARRAAERAARSEAQRNQNQDTRLENSGVDGPNYTHPIIYGPGGQNDPDYIPNSTQGQNNQTVVPQTDTVPVSIGPVKTSQTQAVIKVINDYLKTHSFLELMQSVILNAGR